MHRSYPGASRTAPAMYHTAVGMRPTSMDTVSTHKGHNKPLWEWNSPSGLYTTTPTRHVIPLWACDIPPRLPNKPIGEWNSPSGLYTTTSTRHAIPLWACDIPLRVRGKPTGEWRKAAGEDSKLIWGCGTPPRGWTIP